ncbi:MAG: STAS domain-containing protein [Rhodoferax sp.]|nr:STAS domain-containing protein [Rhodoferax sp.]
MANKQGPTFGLLSRVVKYFREPGSGQTGDQEDTQQQSTQQTRSGETEMRALTERIGRKRQDDLIRRREFDHLRMLGKQPWAVSGSAAVPADRPSRPQTFQHSSGFGVTDAASTIRKIDAIEAHMVNAWGKNKLAAVAPTAPAAASPKTQPAVLTSPKAKGQEQSTAEFATVTRKPVSFTSAASPAAPTGVKPDDDLDLDFTHLAAVSATPGTSALPPSVTEENQASPLESGLQNAAIYFAEGDTASAEAVLLDLLQGDAVTPGDADLLTFALLDLYRATGQQDGFDVVAMDYAERFSRSPAEWFSLPERIQHAAADAVAAAPPPAPKETSDHIEAQKQDASWVCPSLLDEAALTALKMRFPGTNAEWFVDWEPLSLITSQLVTALSDLINFWSANPVQLHWSGVEKLLYAMALHTPADDSTADPQWWLMRMEVLCILGQQEEFESLALDYCVVYEVSPPSWKQVKCQFNQNARAKSRKTGAPGIAQESAADAHQDTELVPLPDAQDSSVQYANCALVGDILGDAAEALAKLAEASRASSQVLVSCALLLRIDFSAAGALLNWAATCESEGCYVHFVQVPRLVAIFFQMLGLDRHAKISVRTN